MTAPDRLLVLAPRGRDAQVIVGQLAGTDPAAEIAGHSQIIMAMRSGDLGVAVITDEAIAGFDIAALAEAVSGQPTWSDIPFIILTRPEFGGWTRAALAKLLGNVTILERPLRGDVLIGGVRSALRARARQRRAQAYLIGREAAEAQVRELAATLETRVLERTAALTRAMAERAHTQRRLRDSELLYRYTVELTAQTPFTADAQGLLVDIAPGWAHLGRAPHDWRRIIHADDYEAVVAAWTTAVATAQPFLSDLRIIAKDGQFGWYRARAAPLLSPAGKVQRWYGTLEDIDERQAAATRLRQMQAELIHVSRLSAMGAMASTLAHELNQPLTAITNYVRGSRLLLAGHPEVARVTDALNEADHNAIRAAEIIRRVRDLVTKGEAQRTPEDLSALVREACSLAMIDAASSGIDFRLQLVTTPVGALVDRIQIQQVLLNLLRNAAEAVAGQPIRQIVVTTRLVSRAWCEVVVSDTGPGVADTAAPRLFEPFNTTKGDGAGGGMGIGLSISRTIIEAHGGTIWYRAGRNGGARFGFQLQRSMPVAPDNL